MKYFSVRASWHSKALWVFFFKQEVFWLFFKLRFLAFSLLKTGSHDLPSINECEQEHNMLFQCQKGLNLVGNFNFTTVPIIFFNMPLWICLHLDNDWHNLNFKKWTLIKLTNKRDEKHLFNMSQKEFSSSQCVK